MIIFPKFTTFLIALNQWLISLNLRICKVGRRLSSSSSFIRCYSFYLILGSLVRLLMTVLVVLGLCYSFVCEPIRFLLELKRRIAIFFWLPMMQGA